MQKRMRWLRHKYNISLPELAEYAGVTNQRLSQIEIDQNKPTSHMNGLVEAAFERLIKEKRQTLAALESDFRKYRKKLLTFVDNQEGES